MGCCRVREEHASIMSSFFSLGGISRSQITDSSDYNDTDNCRQGRLGEGGDDQPNHVLQVPPREISFWYDIRPGYSCTNSGGFIIQQQQKLDLYNYASISSRSSSTSMSMGCGDAGYRRMSMMMMKTSGRGSGGGISCQDCGNHAKKDCSHQRCRTCCRSRGLDCPTHIKSTWVPASMRRERQKQRQLECSSPQACSKQLRGAGTSHGSAQPDHSGPDEMGKFPAEWNSSAVFRCVRVRSSSKDGDQYAYQTAVNIGGHVFMGILYDQGPKHNTKEVAPGESSSCDGSCGGGVTQQPLSLGGRPVESVGAAPTPLFDPYSLTFQPTFNTYNMAGMQFFPHTRF